MYRWLRNIHLVTGLFSVLFLLTYGLSSVQMAHKSWFSLQPRVTEVRIALGTKVRNSPRALARALVESGELYGGLDEVKETMDGYELRISRPGTEYEVSYSRATGQAKIRMSRANFMGLLNALHHVAGFSRGDALVKTWAAFVGLVSAGLIVLAVTGIYLWFKVYKERRVGVVLLGVSLCYSLVLAIYLRLM
jgi:hypothetical protein